MFGDSIYNNKVDEDEECKAKFCVCKKREQFPVNKGNQPAKAFSNYNKWCRIRKEVCKMLSQNVPRPQGRLLMNFGDTFNLVNQEKLLFSYSKINTNFEKYRGNPAFWKLPPGLVDTTNRKLDPIYFAQPSKEYFNIVPPITYTEVPAEIKTELGFRQKTRNVYDKWKKGKYRSEQLEKLAPKLNTIQPYKPDCADLLVKGTQINETDADMQEYIELVDENLTNFEEIESARFQSNESARYEKLGFIINDIKSDECKPEQGSRKVYLFFYFKAKWKIPAKLYLIFKNTGLVTLRFNFRKIEEFRLFKEYQCKDRQPYYSPFYFNKNEVLVTPGSAYKLPVWFVSTRPGKFEELWEITMTPKLWDEDFKLLVSMKGIVYVSDFEQRIQEIKSSLEEGATRQTIADILDNIIDQMQSIPLSDEKNFSYCESLLFESTNEEYNIFKLGPKYIYDKNIVNELKQFYHEVKSLNHPPDWDFSINNLKRITKERDMRDYVEEKTFEMIMTKTLREDQLVKLQTEEEDRIIKEKEWVLPSEKDKKDKKDKGSKGKGEKSSKKSEDVKKNKKDTNTEIEVQVDENLIHLPETHYRELLKILEKLERPAVILNENRVKHLQAFFIMRDSFTKMSIELSYIDDDFKKGHYQSINSESMPENKVFIPERQIYERFNEIYVRRRKRIQSDVNNKFKSLPRAAILKDVPMDDIGLVYKTYFNVTETTKPQEKGKKGGKPQENKSKDSKKFKDDKKSDVKVKISTIKPNFDPYAEGFVITDYKQGLEDSQSLKDLSSFPIQNIEEKSEDYNILIYNTVYDYLMMGIMGVIDCLETFKETNVSRKILHNLQESNVVSDRCIFHANYIPKYIDSNEDLKISPERSKMMIQTTSRNKSVSQLAKRMSYVALTDFKGEDKEYFNNLLKEHWKLNTKTKDFIVKGLRKASKKDSQSSIWSFMKQQQIPYVESSEESVSEETQEEIKLVEERGERSLHVQTSLEFDKVESVEKLSRKSELKHKKSVASVAEKQSFQLFYFLEEDEEHERVGKRGKRKEEDEEIVEKVTDLENDSY